ncbi:MAG: TIM barrel protein [Firmicutes bacterium]|nr:TIM barrel protein [Bacillota bacterium]
MKVNFGICTNFTIKRWSDPDDWARIIKNDLGLDLVQLSFDQFDPRGNSNYVKSYCDKVMTACNRHGINIHSTFTGLSIYSHNLLYHPLLEGRLDGLDWFESAFKMTSYYGVTATGGPFGGMDVNTFQDTSKRKYYETWAEEALVNLLQLAGNKGIKDFYWEPTPVRREGPVTVKETKELMDRINSLTDENSANFSLCLDTGHATSPMAWDTDRNPYHWIEKLGRYAPVIHLQQSDGVLDRHWPFTPEYNKNGIIDANMLIDAIEKSSLDETTLLIEVGHPFEENDDKVLDEVKQSVYYWREALIKREII